MKDMKKKKLDYRNFTKDCPIVGKSLLAPGYDLHESRDFCFAYWVYPVPRAMSNIQDALNFSMNMCLMRERERDGSRGMGE